MVVTSEYIVATLEKKQDVQKAPSFINPGQDPGYQYLIWY